MNDYLKTAPFDLYELHLFHLVAKHRSFTKAAEVAGLTQSAITRQIQGMEESLGLPLLERTTRSVHATPAGRFLEQEALRLIGDVEHSLRRLREDFADARKIIRVGVSRSLGLAYLPGFFHANLRRAPQVGYRVTSGTSETLLAQVAAAELDLAVLCPPARLPRGLHVTHRFSDTFTLLAPAAHAAAFAALRPPQRKPWLLAQDWLLIDDASHTGRQQEAWMKKQGWKIEPTMRLDSFDLIVNLVALGLGVSLVPIRALALYGRKRTLRRLPWPKRFSRQLVVVTRSPAKATPHLAEFVRNVLF